MRRGRRNIFRFDDDSIGGFENLDRKQAHLPHRENRPARLAGTTFLMSVSRLDSDAPKGVNGGLAGHSVLDQGAGPAGSSNVPTATHTPVN
jgi:hypothetical protein